ncbi:MAG: hypothetical protein PHD37_11035 [Gallionellaceae bacterium]|nr:hypothetical protein [Gallionellaceae bacterium]
MNSEPNDRVSAADAGFAKALAEPYAFALLTWPAVIALMAAPDWPAWTRIALWVGLAAMQLAAYTGGRGAGLGNVMLFTSGIVALAAHGHPSPWSLAALPALFIGLHAAQRARLKSARDPVAVAEDTARVGG